jgi:hypothetical protein
MPCYWRTWGKYHYKMDGSRVLNGACKPEGTCMASITVDENGKCMNFLRWEEKPKAVSKSA